MFSLVHLCICAFLSYYFLRRTYVDLYVGSIFWATPVDPVQGCPRPPCTHVGIGRGTTLSVNLEYHLDIARRAPQCALYKQQRFLLFVFRSSFSLEIEFPGCARYARRGALRDRQDFSGKRPDFYEQRLARWKEE
jgi:hypothetical protein